MARYVIQREPLDENIAKVVELSQVPVIGVVKADGYGFGMRYMAEALRSHGIKMFAITEIDDIAPLRDVVEDDDILVMRSTALAFELERIVDSGCIATIGSLNALRALDATARSLGVIARAHMKIDTGFSRYGFLPSDMDAVLECFKCESVKIEGMYTHFSKAYSDLETTRSQLDALVRVASSIREAGFDPGMLHAANSPALLNFADKLDVRLDAVRIGSAFTGRVMANDLHGLERVGYLEARVMDVKDLPAGARMGYGGLVQVDRPTKMAIVSAGQRDGFGIIAKSEPTLKDALSIIRHLRDDGRSHVRIGEQEYPVMGQVDLSTCYVDVTDGDVHIGDVATMDPNPLMVPSSVSREYI